MPSTFSPPHLTGTAHAHKGWLRVIYERPLVVLAMLFCLGLGIISWHLSHLSSRLHERTALHHAALYTEALAAFRTLYAREVVERLRSHRLEVAHESFTNTHAITLPVAMSAALDARIRSTGSGVQTRLFTHLPFPGHTSAGPRDAFDREALAHLQRHPEQPFARFETYAGRWSLRYATADRMRQSCLDCHNNHPQSPKTNWQVGDMSGVLEVVIPMDGIQEQRRTGLRTTFLLMAGMHLGGLSLLALVIGALRRSAAEAGRFATQAHHAATETARVNQVLQTQVAERGRAEAALQQAKHAAETAARSKGTFLANMSHEIRTPLNGVIGMTSLLMDTELSTEQQELCAAIDRSGDALLCLINDILDFSKIEAGKLTLETIDFAPRTAIEDVLELLTEPAYDKGLELTAVVPDDVPALLRGDPGRLRQILTNLVGNAVKFTEAGEVVVRLTLAAEQSEAMLLRFQVVDTGIGIAADAQQYLFNAFAQAEDSTTRKYGGTGLGLAISKQLVGLMDGDIGMHSAPGQGSIFWFTVRLRKSTSPCPPQGPNASVLRGVRVLCVVNHGTYRSVLESQLTTWGMQVRCVDNGLHALTVLRAAHREARPYDLALLDHQLPDMQGLPLARAIKAEPTLAGVRLVLLTRFGRPADSEDALTTGCAACLTKPIRQSHLYRCLTTALGMQGQVTPSQPPSAPAPVAEASTVAQAHVLVVEDNLVNQRVTVRLLEKLGCHVDVAANGRQALDAVARHTYDIVFMDCQMPEMDGFEATGRIRQQEQQTGCHVSIVAMTANAMPGDRERCLAAGMDDYMSKPVKPRGLKSILDTWARHPATRNRDATSFVP